MPGEIFNDFLSPVARDTSLPIAEDYHLQTTENTIDQKSDAEKTEMFYKGFQSQNVKDVILVVEDDSKMSQFIASSLQSEYEVITAFDGKEGLQKALVFGPALIVSGISLPAISGEEMITALRSQDDMKDTPILILCGQEDEALRHQLLEEKVQDYIAKPFTEKDICVRVRNLIMVKKTGEKLKKAEQKLAEKEEYLRQQSSMLEYQVEERTKELNEQNRSLKSSNEDLQQFAHVASHDLKEPIRKIKTYSARLRDEYKDHLPEKGSVFLDKIFHATSRVYDMIDGVLNYSTLASLDLATEEVDLNEIMGSIEADLEVVIQEKNARIDMDELPSIEGVSILLYQLFYNLVNNALKFSVPGKTPLISITSSEEKIGDVLFVRIAVRDNGIGFDQENAEKIFTTFTRLNSKDHYEGTGLGLALCRKIAQRHKGTITANSEAGKGATFILLLPFKQ